MEVSTQIDGERAPAVPMLSVGVVAPEPAGLFSPL